MNDHWRMTLYNPEEPVIHVGAWYTFHRSTPAGTGYTVRLKAVKKYKHHVLFADAKGIKESIGYWEIARTIRG